MRFKLLSTPEDMAELKTFREEVYSEKHEYLLQQQDRTASIDASSWNFGVLNDHNELIGTSRCTPYVDGAWEASGLIPAETEKLLNPATYVQFNRVAIRRDHRNMGLHEYMFMDACMWCYGHLDYEYFFSICETKLLRKYRKFLIRSLGEPFRIESRKGKEYCVIHGNVAELAAFVKRQSIVQKRRKQ